MRISTMRQTTYIATLPEGMQDDIRRILSRAGFTAEDIDLAMNSRICDLEDAIDLQTEV